MKAHQMWSLVAAFAVLVLCLGLTFACSDNGSDDDSGDDNSPGDDDSSCYACIKTWECISAFGDGWACQGECCIQVSDDDTGDDDDNDNDNDNDDVDDDTSPDDDNDNDDDDDNDTTDPYWQCVWGLHSAAVVGCNLGWFFEEYGGVTGFCGYSAEVAQCGVDCVEEFQGGDSPPFVNENRRLRKKDFW